uniref:MAPK regulated corepressor interacting protein 2 n=1 Tax=Neogobius melanostomus TaxID=47308 RepID=A0A8C6TRR6_9GOBI
MYTISRGPSKLVTQRRTGPTQQLDNQINDFKHKQSSWSMPDLPAPKIVFNRLNGKKYHPLAPAINSDHQEESFTPAHEDNVRFVHEAWQEVVERSSSQGPEGAQKPTQYEEESPSPHMSRAVSPKEVAVNRTIIKSHDNYWAAVAQLVPHSKKVPGSIPTWTGPFCVEFACSPRVCVGFLRVPRFPQH